MLSVGQGYNTTNNKFIIELKLKNKANKDEITVYTNYRIHRAFKKFHNSINCKNFTVPGDFLNA